MIEHLLRASPHAVPAISRLFHAVKLGPSHLTSAVVGALRSIGENMDEALMTNLLVLLKNAGQGLSGKELTSLVNLTDQYGRSVCEEVLGRKKNPPNVAVAKTYLRASRLLSCHVAQYQSESERKSTYRYYHSAQKGVLFNTSIYEAIHQQDGKEHKAHKDALRQGKAPAVAAR